jgi:uncharacterized protein YutE (UPF0331/DUF86 family)
MLAGIRALPLESRTTFSADSRNIWSAESCLRRALEALFDIGRHVLARGYGLGLSEYHEIASKLADRGVLSAEESALLSVLAGYRNRLVHFYHEVSIDELYEVCARDLGDLETIRAALVRWLKAHPEMVDETL